MGLNTALALEILEIARQRPRGIALPAIPPQAEEHREVRRCFRSLVRGRFLVAQQDDQYVLTQRGNALIDSLGRQLEKEEERRKKLSTLVLDVLGF